MKLIFRRMFTGEVGLLMIPWLPNELINPEIELQCNILFRDIMTILPPRETVKQLYETVRLIHFNSNEKNSLKYDEHLCNMIEMYLSNTPQKSEEEMFKEFEKHFESSPKPDDSDGIIFN